MSYPIDNFGVYVNSLYPQESTHLSTPQPSPVSSDEPYLIPAPPEPALPNPPYLQSYPNIVLHPYFTPEYSVLNFHDSEHAPLPHPNPEFPIFTQVPIVNLNYPNLPVPQNADSGKSPELNAQAVAGKVFNSDSFVPLADRSKKKNLKLSTLNIKQKTKGASNVRTFIDQTNFARVKSRVAEIKKARKISSNTPQEKPSEVSSFFETSIVVFNTNFNKLQESLKSEPDPDKREIIFLELIALQNAHLKELAKIYGDLKKAKLRTREFVID